MEDDNEVLVERDSSECFCMFKKFHPVDIKSSPMAPLTLEDIYHFSTAYFANEVINQVRFASFDGYVTSTQARTYLMLSWWICLTLNWRARLLNSCHFSSSLSSVKIGITQKKFDYLKWLNYILLMHKLLYKYFWVIHIDTYRLSILGCKHFCGHCQFAME